MHDASKNIIWSPQFYKYLFSRQCNCIHWLREICTAETFLTNITIILKFYTHLYTFCIKRPLHGMAFVQRYKLLVFYNVKGTFVYPLTWKWIYFFAKLPWRRSNNSQGSSVIRFLLHSFRITSHAILAFFAKVCTFKIVKSGRFSTSFNYIF